MATAKKKAPAKKPPKQAAKAKAKAKTKPAAKERVVAKKAAAKQAAPKKPAAPRSSKPKASATPAKKAAPAKTPRVKAPRIKIALIRKLAKLLERPGDAHQVQALSDQLAEQVPAEHHGIAAAGILAETAGGSELARTYLTALGDDEAASSAANELARHCATMERGRKALRAAFAATWRKATDIDAVDAAYKNFARGLLDDPVLLDAGIDAAMKRGDTAGATALAARLERASRLAPLVARLADEATRGEAAGELAQLGHHDRWQVHARVVDNPRRFAPEVAVDAVRMLADDPSVPDLALSATIPELRGHGLPELVAGWATRVAAGDPQLVVRLLGLFELTALWANEHLQLAPYIEALHPASGQPEVFASVEHALAGNSAVAREAVLSHWLKEPERTRNFTDTQIDKLVRMTVTIAEGGQASRDGSAATHALFFIQHPGAHLALADAIRNANTARNPKLRANLYTGISNGDHAAVLAFLVERLFVERDEYERLLQLIGWKVDQPDNAAHLRVLGILVERSTDANAIHAVTAYADAILRRELSSRLLLDVARVVASWMPTNNDDARRLRYVFEQATEAALRIARPDDARRFLACARALPDSPYSDYWVHGRNDKTPAAFATRTTNQLIVDLEAGMLDREIADTRAAAEHARAAGTPIAADDRRLSILGNCVVKQRFFEEGGSRVVWFFDEVGGLQVYDGYTVAPPTFQVVTTRGAGLEYRSLAAFVAGHPMIDERALFFDIQKPARVRELLRLGDRVLVFDGTGDSYMSPIRVTPVGLRYATTAEARHAYTRLLANPPDDLPQVDPWSLEDRGRVRRQYYVPPPGGGHDALRSAMFMIANHVIQGDVPHGLPPLVHEHANHNAAVTALEAWETRALAAGGGMTAIWIVVWQKGMR